MGVFSSICYKVLKQIKNIPVAILLIKKFSSTEYIPKVDLAILFIAKHSEKKLEVLQVWRTTCLAKFVDYKQSLFRLVC